MTEGPDTGLDSDISLMGDSRSGLVPGTDGLLRCGWVGATGKQHADYLDYHDREWAVPVHGEQVLLERLCLEAFQSGLSWLTILRKREGFRAAFAYFHPETVAAFGPEEIEALMHDSAIVRNRRKIAATIANAAATIELRRHGGLDAAFWASRPASHRRPASLRDVPASTAESAALAKRLKSAGFAFLGPITMYAAMQACGVVDDHVRGCFRATGSPAA